MLTIRFNRIGKRNRAQFRVVLQEHTIAPGGRHVEVLGSYDPHSKKAVLTGERIKFWIGKGAQVSDTVYNLFVSQGVISGKKRPIKISKKPVEAEAKEEKKPEVKTEKTAEPEVPKAEVAEEAKPEKPAAPASAEAATGEEEKTKEKSTSAEATADNKKETPGLVKKEEKAEEPKEDIKAGSKEEVKETETKSA